MPSIQGARPLEGTPRRSDRFIQADVLREAIDRIEHTGIAVFDLDSTLLDNRPRQARIVRELGEELNDARLKACAPEDWVDWEIETTLSNRGLPPDEVRRLAPRAKSFWRERFFTSEYCADDRPTPGAADYLRRVSVTGATICYVTGRHTEMGPGSVESFRRAGFPLPDGVRVHLMLKPQFTTADDDWKVLAREQLLAIGRVACAFDNEPSHINSYRVGFPQCYPVHLDTDHSGRPVDVLPEIPSIRDFLL